VTFTVAALDVVHKVVDGADVLIDGKKTRKVTMRIDPKAHAHIPEVTQPADSRFQAGLFHRSPCRWNTATSPRRK